MSDIPQILDDNGIKYHTSPKHRYTLILEDLEIVNCEPMIEYIDVKRDRFIIFINFEDCVPNEPNFGLDFDVDDYSLCSSTCTVKRCRNKDDFINELHQLNFTGSNIKG